jgi:hypothetical protein
MTMDEPFETGPDPALGAELKRLFDPGDDSGFAARVLSRLPQRRGSTLWDVLAYWTRPGIAAAVMAAAQLCYWEALRETEALTAEPVTELAATDRDLDRDVLVGVVLGSGQQ